MKQQLNKQELQSWMNEQICNIFQQAIQSNKIKIF